MSRLKDFFEQRRENKRVRDILNEEDHYLF